MRLWLKRIIPEGIIKKGSKENSKVEEVVKYRKRKLSLKDASFPRRGGQSPPTPSSAHLSPNSRKININN
jgi:hypothetical protein